ncbi:MAG TPA: hypothetical protein VNO31_11110 [Umezawaea sp.]|nr:hypothetical protein [Umezawaea sp.]
MDYISMSVSSDRARSHGWWRNVVEFDPWDGPGETRVGPPTPEAIQGIAKLFGTTTERVSAMVAQDWYGVGQASGHSSRVARLAHDIDRLSEKNTDLIEQLIKQLVTAK